MYSIKIKRFDRMWYDSVGNYLLAQGFITPIKYLGLKVRVFMLIDVGGSAGNCLKMI